MVSVLCQISVWGRYMVSVLCQISLWGRYMVSVLCQISVWGKYMLVSAPGLVSVCGSLQGTREHIPEGSLDG